jgi:hypothetical protein
MRYTAKARRGEVPEWLNGTVSKTVVLLVGTVGSNPTLSARDAKNRPYQSHKVGRFPLTSPRKLWRGLPSSTR